MNNLLLVTLLLLAALFSCQSEYDRQLIRGKQLVEQENKVVNQLLQTHFNDSARETLIALKEDLAHCAVLSGNQELFYAQISNYRSSIKSDSYNNRLITKYP
jgi:hypothetical protein